ncbi:MAG: hypothetical protein ACI3W5_17070 [Faecousia sp.]
MCVRERILTIRLMEKLASYPEQADLLGILLQEHTGPGECKTESENTI